MERASAIREHLFSLTQLGIKYDLDRMVAASAAIGNPQACCPCFHVAGTNGKGSVCTYLESALRACGHKTGLFVSPHLVRFEERFQIDGRPVGESAWLGVYDSLRPVIDDLNLTFFEATTLMAFELFKRERVDWAVFETGLGGRLDATNVVVPVVSVITRLAMDHTDYLGDNLLSIAGEKLGIVKNNVPLVMARPESAEIGALAADICNARHAPLRLVDLDTATDITTDDRGASFTYNNRRYRIHLPGGDFQVKNALLALGALHEAGIDDHAAIACGLERAWLPGRFQVVVRQDKTMVFDVGHNPDAAETFRAGLERRFFKGATNRSPSVCILLGIMKDKDYPRMLPHFARCATRLILAKPATSRAAATGDLRRAVPADFTGECLEYQSIPEAMAGALNGPEKIIVVAGSFFTVGEAMREMGIEPYGKDLPELGERI